MSKKAWIYLGNELKKFREEKILLSQVDFAKTLGISKSLVCKVEAGERKYNLETLEAIFANFPLDDYSKLKFLTISELPFKLKNSEDECFNVIKLTIELKNKGLFFLAKRLISQSLETFDDFVDFYVLLSTVNLMENKYDESEKNINIALNLYHKGIKSISTESDMYHNYGNIFFNMSYQYEFKRLELISNLVKENQYKEQITKNKDYIEINNKILSLYNQTEEYFLKSYNLNQNNIHVVAQLARLYFNISNLDIDNKENIDRAYKFLNIIEERDDLPINDRVELSILLSIIMSLKNMAQEAVVLLNNIICFRDNNPLTYYAKSIAYLYKSNNDVSILNKAFDNLHKTLEISNFDNGMKLQVLGDFNFELFRSNDNLNTKFELLLFN